jgi:hypothetical protein
VRPAEEDGEDDMEEGLHARHLAMTENLMTDLTKLIRKLRWIGLEDQARQLEVAIAKFPPLAGADMADQFSGRH